MKDKYTRNVQCEWWSCGAVCVTAVVSASRECLETKSEQEFHELGMTFAAHILLTVRLVMNLSKWPTWRTILFYVFISIIYMFRATSCSSSGESIVSIHLLYVTLCRWPFRLPVGKDLHTKRSPTQSDIYIPDVVLIQLILLMMSTRLLETCR